METVLFDLGGRSVTAIEVLAGGLAITVLLLLVMFALQMRASRQRAADADEEARRASEMERHLADMMRIQSEMTGRMQTMSEIFGSRTSDLAKLLTDRI